MRENYSQARRDMIGALNRGKNFSAETIERIRKAALARGPVSDETRKKNSDKSPNAKYMLVTRLGGGVLPNGELSIIIKSHQKVADFLLCSEKTVRRALAANGIVKNTFLVKVIPRPS